MFDSTDFVFFVFFDDKLTEVRLFGRYCDEH